MYLKQKGSALIRILLLGLLVILTLGFYYFSYSKRVENLTPPRTLEIYKNDLLGFELKYSKNLKIVEDSEKEFNKRGKGEFRKNFTSYIGYQPAEFLGATVVLDSTLSYESNPLTIWVFNNSRNFTIEKWYRDFWYYPFVWGDFTSSRYNVAPVNEATISGEMGKSAVLDYRSGNPKFIYLMRREKMYLFRVIGKDGEKLIQNIKFLDSESSSE